MTLAAAPTNAAINTRMKGLGAVETMTETSRANARGARTTILGYQGLPEAAVNAPSSFNAAKVRRESTIRKRCDANTTIS